MDALEFVRQRRRMCSAFELCELCPIGGVNCMICTEDYTEDEDKRIIAAVEKWSKEHPKNTRQSEMLKLFPNTILDGYGVVDICPQLLGRDRGGCEGEECHECRARWWQAEVIE